MSHLTLLHPEWPELQWVLAILSVMGLRRYTGDHLSDEWIHITIAQQNNCNEPSHHMLAWKNIGKNIPILFLPHLIFSYEVCLYRFYVQLSWVFALSHMSFLGILCKSFAKWKVRINEGGRGDCWWKWLSPESLCQYSQGHALMKLVKSRGSLFLRSSHPLQKVYIIRTSKLVSGLPFITKVNMAKCVILSSVGRLLRNPI